MMSQGNTHKGHNLLPKAGWASSNAAHRRYCSRITFFDKNCVANCPPCPSASYIPAHGKKICRLCPRGLYLWHHWQSIVYLFFIIFKYQFKQTTLCYCNSLFLFLLRIEMESFFFLYMCYISTKFLEIIDFCVKVHIFWEAHKILRNFHHRFVLCSNSLIYVGNFVKFRGPLRIYELYWSWRLNSGSTHLLKNSWNHILTYNYMFLKWRYSLKL